MRDFVWNCFQVTGSVDAYLLYKDLEERFEQWRGKDQQQEDENQNLQS